MRPVRVGIIGGGCSGVLTALQLLGTSGDIVPEVWIIERGAVLGRGLAYEVPSDRCKLNVPVQGMSAYPDDPEDFVRWMQARDPAIRADEFVSRGLYGAYLEDRLRHCCENRNGTLHTIHDEVTDLDYVADSRQWRIVLKGSPALEVEYCVLALGNQRRATFCGVPVGDVFYDPYRRDTYEALCDSQSLLIVGSGLTAVDAVMEAEGHGFRGCYTMLSRHGRLPLPHEAQGQLPDPALFCASNLTALSLRALTRLCVSKARAQGSSQAVIMALRPHLQEVWSALSAKDRKRFLRHVRSLWEVHRHRIPRPHHEVLQALKQQGRLAVLAGHVHSVYRGEDGVSVELAARGVILNRLFAGAILCAGPESDVSRIDSELVSNLLRRGIIEPGPLGLGAIVAGDPAQSSSLALIGPLQREALWEITAVREIRQEAARIAQRVFQYCRAVGSA